VGPEDKSPEIAEAIETLNAGVGIVDSHPLLARIVRSVRRTPSRRLAAIRLVSQCRAAVATPALLALLANPSFAYRADVVRALAQMEDDTARSALMAALSDPAEDVRREAVSAIASRIAASGTATEDAQDMLAGLLSVVKNDPAPLVRYAAYRAIVTSGNWPATLTALADARRDSHAMLRCAFVMDRAALARLSGQDEPLRDAAVEFRTILAETAGRQRFSLARSAYRARYPCPGLRAAAVQSLGRMGQPGDVPALVEILRTDLDGAVRVAAIGALVECGGDAALAGVISALDDPIVTVRITAVDALASFNDPHAGEALENVLRHGRPLDRQHAATALLMIADHAPALVDALSDDTVQVRRAAEATLVAQQERDSIPPLIDLLSDVRPALRIRAGAVLARYRGAASRAQLVAVLRVGAAPSAPLAAMALGLRGEPEARPELEAALARGDFPDPIALVHALQDLGQPESVPALAAFAERATDAQAKAAAAQAVVRLAGVSS
jgi:HEAT repeat protein